VRQSTRSWPLLSARLHSAASPLTALLPRQPRATVRVQGRVGHLPRDLKWQGKEGLHGRARADQKSHASLTAILSMFPTQRRHANAWESADGSTFPSADCQLGSAQGAIVRSCECTPRCPPCSLVLSTSEAGHSLVSSPALSPLGFAWLASHSCPHPTRAGTARWSACWARNTTAVSDAEIIHHPPQSSPRTTNERACADQLWFCVSAFLIQTSCSRSSADNGFSSACHSSVT
jgi:hypothetical protein